MPEPEYLHPNPSTNYVPAICNQCGALVAREANAMVPHNEWHAKMDELIEWAQSLDKRLFPQKVKDTFTLPHVTNEQIVAGRMIDGPSLSDGIPRDDV